MRSEIDWIFCLANFVQKSGSQFGLFAGTHLGWLLSFKAQCEAYQLTPRKTKLAKCSMSRQALLIAQIQRF